MFKVREQRIAELNDMILRTGESRGFITRIGHVVIPDLREQHLHAYLNGRISRDEFINGLKFVCSCPPSSRPHSF
jgi:hypothetical protein